MSFSVTFALAEPNASPAVSAEKYFAPDAVTCVGAVVLMGMVSTLLTDPPTYRNPSQPSDPSLSVSPVNSNRRSVVWMAPCAVATTSPANSKIAPIPAHVLISRLPS